MQAIHLTKTSHFQTVHQVEKARIAALSQKQTKYQIVSAKLIHDISRRVTPYSIVSSEFQHVLFLNGMCGCSLPDNKVPMIVANVTNYATCQNIHLNQELTKVQVLFNSPTP
jgi:hypothetical protein